MLELLLVAGGVGTMLAVGVCEKWRHAQGGVPAPLTDRPTWQAAANELARTLRPLETEVRAYLDENQDMGVVVLVRGLDPELKLRSTGRTTGDVEVGHLGF